MGGMCSKAEDDSATSTKNPVGGARKKAGKVKSVEVNYELVVRSRDLVRMGLRSLVDEAGSQSLSDMARGWFEDASGTVNVQRQEGTTPLRPGKSSGASALTKAEFFEEAAAGGCELSNSEYDKAIEKFVEEDMVQRGIFLDFMTASPRKDATESESRIRSKMRAMVLNYQAKVDGLASAEAIFAKLDADGNGKLSRAEFFDGITDVGVTLSDDEYDALWLVLDPKDKRTIALERFSSFMNNDDSAARGRVRAGMLAWVAEYGAAFSCSADYAAAKLFNEMDKDGNGELSRTEFWEGLIEKCEVTLTDEEYDMMMATMDPRGKKYISMDNWTSFMGSSYITAARKRTADFLMARMEAIQATTETDDDYGKLASLLFKEMDTDGNGELSKEEFFNAITGTGEVVDLLGESAAPEVATLELTDAEYDAMWAYLDPTDKHALSMSQWISFIKKAVTYEFRYADVVRARDLVRAALSTVGGASDQSDAAITEGCRQYFANFKQNTDGEASKDDLMDGLTAIGVRFADAEYDALWARLDTSGSASCNAEDFAQTITGNFDLLEDDLMKLGGKQKNKWQKRHFKLFGNAVAWNKDEASEIDWREAGCSLATIKSVAEIATYKKQENCFEIVGMEKTWQIGCADAEERTKWVDAIEDLLSDKTPLVGARNKVLARVLDMNARALADELNGGSGPELMFGKLDADENGTLDKQELMEGLDARGCKLTDEEYDALWLVLDPAGNHETSLPQWCDFMGGKDQEAQHMIVAKLLSVDAPNVDGKRLAPGGAAKIFQDLDSDGSGTLEKAELWAALEGCGVDTDDTTYDCLWGVLDPKRTGGITMGDWEDFVNQEYSSCARRRVINALRLDANGDGTLDVDECTKAFKAIDRSGNGLLDKYEMITALKDAGLELTNQEHDAFWLDIDPLRYRQLTLDNWIAWAQTAI